MTRYGPEPGHSTFDLPLEFARDRQTGLRAESRRAHPAGRDRSAGVIGRLRNRVGYRLIALGAAIAVPGQPQDRRVVG